MRLELPHAMYGVFGADAEQPLAIFLSKFDADDWAVSERAKLWGPESNNRRWTMQVVLVHLSGERTKP